MFVSVQTQNANTKRNTKGECACVSVHVTWKYSCGVDNTLSLIGKGISSIGRSNVDTQHQQYLYKYNNIPTPIPLSTYIHAGCILLSKGYLRILAYSPLFPYVQYHTDGILLFTGYILILTFPPQGYSSPRE